MSRGVLLGTLLLVAGCESTFGPPAPLPLTPAQADVLAALERGLASIDDGAACTERPNDDGTLSWGASYVLQAHLDAFLGTGDVRFLDRFRRQADEVLAIRDDRLDRADHRGVAGPVWSATRYSTAGERAAWLVDQAVIVAPLARFAAIAAGDPRVPWRLRLHAARYRRAAVDALAHFDADFRSDPGTGRGWYILPAGSPTSTGHPTEDRPNPLNWDAAAGLVHLLLSEAGAGVVHRERAVAIAGTIAVELLLDGDRYVWHYWGGTGRPLYNSAWEDIAHASIEVEFIARMATAGLAFDRADVERLARTLLSQQAPEGGFHRRVYGADPDVLLDDPKCGRVWRRAYSDAAGLWLVIADVGPAIVEPVARHLRTRLETDVFDDPQILAGLALLVGAADRATASPTAMRAELSATAR